MPQLNLALATNDATEALEYVNAHGVDLILLDIEMPDLSGIEFIQSLKKPAMVIFTTAYEEYAVKGYELEVVDYLVKPIRFERFEMAINRALKRFMANSGKDASNYPNTIAIKVDYKNVVLSISEILFIEGLKDYVKIYTTTQMYLTRLNLKGIHEILPHEKFIRVHRSFIVSIGQISSFSKSEIGIGSTTIPIGNSYKESHLHRL